MSSFLFVLVLNSAPTPTHQSPNTSIIKSAGCHNSLGISGPCTLWLDHLEGTLRQLTHREFNKSWTRISGIPADLTGVGLVLTGEVSVLDSEGHAGWIMNDDSSSERVREFCDRLYSHMQKCFCCCHKSSRFHVSLDYPSWKTKEHSHPDCVWSDRLNIIAMPNPDPDEKQKGPLFSRLWFKKWLDSFISKYKCLHLIISIIVNKHLKNTNGITGVCSIVSQKRSFKVKSSLDWMCSVTSSLGVCLHFLQNWASALLILSPAPPWLSVLFCQGNPFPTLPLLSASLTLCSPHPPVGTLTRFLLNNSQRSFLLSITRDHSLHWNFTSILSNPNHGHVRCGAKSSLALSRPFSLLINKTYTYYPWDGPKLHHFNVVIFYLWDLNSRSKLQE